MRRGPKFEITQEMAIHNIKTVCRRLGITSITKLIYREHGSFSDSAIERKFGWARICRLAGVCAGRAGGKKASWRPCRECAVRLAAARYCQTCTKRMNRQSHGALA